AAGGAAGATGTVTARWGASSSILSHLGGLAGAGSTAAGAGGTAITRSGTAVSFGLGADNWVVFPAPAGGGAVGAAGFGGGGAGALGMPSQPGWESAGFTGALPPSSGAGSGQGGTAGNGGAGGNATTN